MFKDSQGSHIYDPVSLNKFFLLAESEPPPETSSTMSKYVAHVDQLIFIIFQRIQAIQCEQFH